MKKRFVLATAVSCLLFSGPMAVSYAYLTDADHAVNPAGITENEIHIEETFDPPDEILPGSVIPKAPRIVNDSAIPVYVRLSVQFSDMAAAGLCEPLAINAGWKDGGDGYYYYSGALAPSETTAALFDAVTIRSDCSVDDLIPFDLLVYAESVQTYGQTWEEAWQL